MMVAPEILEQKNREKKTSIAGQMSLFDFVGEESKDDFRLTLPDVAEYPKEELLAFEKETLGIYVSGHPMDAYESMWRKNITATTIDFIVDEETNKANVMDNSIVTIGGMVTGKTTKATRTGQMMAFITLEDMLGSVEVLVFPNVYESNRELFREEEKLFIQGRVSIGDDPVGKLICASNRNDVLTDFIRTGVYDRNRPFHTTMSPSMDILVSSNLERLLFDMSGGKDELVREYMDQLARTGRYEVTAGMKQRMQEVFWGGFCNEEDTAAAVARMYQNGYLIDPHTAVAAKVLEDYRRETGDRTVSVFVSTASPYKFCDSVLSAIGETPAENSVDRIGQMAEITGVTAPERLAALKSKTPRFSQVTEREKMEDVVLEFLK